MPAVGEARRADCRSLGVCAGRGSWRSATVAQQAAVAIDNARLYENLRDTATLEERQRLARELHDSVSQALYGIALNASAVGRTRTASQTRLRSSHARTTEFLLGHLDAWAVTRPPASAWTYTSG